MRPRWLYASCLALTACGVVAPPAPAPAKQAMPGAPQAAAPAKEAKPPAAPASAAAPAKATAPAKTPAPAAPRPAPVVVAGPPPIDLKSLEQKLKDSKAIGVMTKLALKNQVDDLVSRFRAFHGGQRPPTLAELRQPYELLLMKVLALVQDQDPNLAKALHDSRDSIWSVLADRDKFLANL